MQIIRFAVMLLFTAGFLSACQSPPPPRPASSFDVEGLRPYDVHNRRVKVFGRSAWDLFNAEAERKLRQPIKADLTGANLVNVIDAIRTETGLNFFVNWAALEASGIEADLPAAEVPGFEGKKDELAYVLLERALKLADYFRGTDFSGLDHSSYAVIDGIVHVTTKRDLDRYVQTRVYVLPASMLQPRSVSGERFDMEFDLNEALSSTSTGRGQSTTITTTDPALENTLEYDLIIEQYTTLIQDTIGRSSEWAAYGGEISSLSVMHGNLVIRTTRANHQAIEELLNNLAEIKSLEEELRNDEVASLLDRADGLRLKHQYAAALRLVKAALNVSPQHARGEAMKQAIEEAIERR